MGSENWQLRPSRFRSSFAHRGAWLRLCLVCESLFIYTVGLHPTPLLYPNPRPHTSALASPFQPAPEVEWREALREAKSRTGSFPVPPGVEKSVRGHPSVGPEVHAGVLLTTPGRVTRRPCSVQPRGRLRGGPDIWGYLCNRVRMNIPSPSPAVLSRSHDVPLSLLQVLLFFWRTEGGRREYSYQLA